jgi:hypothetical protein
VRWRQDIGTIRQEQVMPQLVFEFWSQEIEAVVEAITRVLDGSPTENEIAPASLRYEPTQKGLDWGVTQVRTGLVVSFVLRPENGAIRYAMLNGPDVGGVQRPGYMGTIEYTRNDYIQIWSRLLGVDGLRIVCLGFEEGVEFNRDHLETETFPWDDSFLVIGAVRSREGDWIMKHGSSYFPAEDE